MSLKRTGLYDHNVVRLSQILLYESTDFYETSDVRYHYYVTGNHRNAIYFNFIKYIAIFKKMRTSELRAALTFSGLDSDIDVKIAR